MKRLLSTPHLGPSQLSFRIGLARRRLSAYPLDDINFIFNNIERPRMSRVMADWWTGDLSGRILEALSASDGVDGVHDARLTAIYERLLRNRQPEGYIGEFAADPVRQSADGFPNTVLNKILPGLVRYYRLTGDLRALDAAESEVNYLLRHKDAWMAYFKPDRPIDLYNWVADGIAQLYEITGDKRYEQALRETLARLGGIEYAHTHGAMTTLRAYQRMAHVTGDMSWNEKPELFRRRIAEKHYESVAGDIPEGFPMSPRNESCSTADWMQLNLWAGLLLSGEAADSAYAKAEHIFWNALAYNQIVTGGFGHRQFLRRGYGTMEFQEAWWCCTENALLAMSEYARHCVTADDEEIRVNMLVPGVYEVDGASVQIASLWPGRAEARVSVRDPRGRRVYVRRPEGVADWREERSEQPGGLQLHLTGRVGHTVEPWEDRFALKYGILILAPGNNTWVQRENALAGSTIPAGYEGASFSSMDFRVELPAADESGFYPLNHLPLPNWIFYEESPDSRTSFENVSVTVPIVFDDGQRADVRFWPLCYFVSTLTFYALPLLFRL